MKSVPREDGCSQDTLRDRAVYALHIPFKDTRLESTQAHEVVHHDMGVSIQRCTVTSKLSCFQLAIFYMPPPPPSSSLSPSPPLLSPLLPDSFVLLSSTSSIFLFVIPCSFRSYFSSTILTYSNSSGIMLRVLFCFVLNPLHQSVDQQAGQLIENK